MSHGEYHLLSTEPDSFQDLSESSSASTRYQLPQRDDIAFLNISQRNFRPTDEHSSHRKENIKLPFSNEVNVVSTLGPKIYCILVYGKFGHSGRAV